jgi:hypothetical protein
MSDDREFHGGRLPAPDARDANYPARRMLDALAVMLPRGIPPGTRYYEPGPILDQDDTGTCVLHAVVEFIEGAPIMSKPTGPDDLNPLLLYDEAAANDEFPANDHDAARQYGTSVRAGIETMRGRVANYYWAATVDEAIDWHLANLGTALIGMDWKSAMMRTDERGFVGTGGRVEGGHCIKTTGWSHVRDAFRCQQSWGRSWGQNGLFWLPAAEVRAQLAAGTAELCLPTEIRLPKVAPTR